MVFDYPPCNNNEVPLYFLKKLYCEFVLNEVPNYFDFSDFFGRGGGSAQSRPGARVGQPRIPHAPKPPLPSVIPPTVKEVVEIDTLHALRELTDTLTQHSTQIASGDVGGGASSSAPHHCGSCGAVCTAGETSFAGSQDFFSIDEMLGNVFGTGATDIGLSQVNFK